jgi:hypothetical protein
MDLSALQSAAKALEGSLDTLGFWLYASTALVVIGLITEYRHEVVEFWEEVRRPAAMFPWQKFWAIAGGVLVTVGVAGELIVGISASRKEGNLRIINHQIEALLTDEASKNEREAAQLRMDAEEMKQAFAPRHLDTAQVSAISLELSHFAKQPVVAISNPFDAEASIFAAEILSALKSAKWDTTVPHFAVGRNVSSLERAPSIPVTGILIQFGSGDKRSRSAAYALVRELSGKGFDCRMPKKSTVSIGPDPLVLVDVEARPEGPQGDAKERAEARKIRSDQINR